MKHKRLSLLLFIALTMLILAGCSGYSPVRGTLVMGDTYRLKSGQTLEDDLTVMGGVAELESGSTVNGDVSVMGGTVRADGIINGDISVMGGSVQLGEAARVSGDVTQFGGSVNRTDGAIVEGDFGDEGPTFRVPPVPPMSPPRANINFDPIFRPFMAFFQALAIAALAVLVYLFASRPMERVGQAALGAPVVAGGIGLLTIIVAPALLVILGITIILLPISLLGILLAGIAWIFGWVTIGLLTGRQVARWLNQSWADPINAGIGTLIISLVASLFDIVIPCIGWMPGFLVGIVGLGAVVLTRFGTQNYTSNGSFPGTGSAAGAPYRPQAPYTPAPSSPAYRPPAATPPAQTPMYNPDPIPGARANTNDFFGTDEPANATFVQDVPPTADEPDTTPDHRDDEPNTPTL
jgi:hypothetical protein